MAGAFAIYIFTNLAYFLHISKKSSNFAPQLQNKGSMSATDYLNNAQAWLAQQSQRTIDYQWEIQHHNQMHKTYETSL